RAEALVPVVSATEGDVIRGQVRYLEHHGHESLAFLDIGATAVIVDEMASTTPPSTGVQNGLRRLITRLTGRGGGAEADTDGHAVIAEGRANNHKSDDSRVFGDGGRHHRRPAELAVRLAPYPALNHGTPLAVRVRMEALHFFDERGQRIDVGW